MNIDNIVSIETSRILLPLLDNNVDLKSLMIKFNLDSKVKEKFKIQCSAKLKTGKRCSRARKFGEWCGHHIKKHEFGRFIENDYLEMEVNRILENNYFVDIKGNYYTNNLKNPELIENIVK